MIPFSDVACKTGHGFRFKKLSNFGVAHNVSLVWAGEPYFATTSFS